MIAVKYKISVLEFTNIKQLILSFIFKKYEYALLNSNLYNNTLNLIS